jgi:hypothetical protein
MNIKFQSTLAECRPRQCHVGSQPTSTTTRLKQMNKQSINRPCRDEVTEDSSEHHVPILHITSTHLQTEHHHTSWLKTINLSSTRNILINDLFGPLPSIWLSSRRHQVIIPQILSKWVHLKLCINATLIGSCFFTSCIHFLAQLRYLGASEFFFFHPCMPIIRTSHCPGISGLYRSW